MQTVQMPKTWDDAKGWEQYYSFLYPHGEYQGHAAGLGSIGGHLSEFINDLKAKQRNSIWVPGCGLSPLARVLSDLGYEAHATDVSRSAIEFQQSEANDVKRYFSEMERAACPGEFICAVHDFRHTYLHNHFDVIVNVKAFQGFSPEAMREIAQVHFAALKPGGEAFFDTRNVQGERRDILEESLVTAGFFLPFYELTRWYRKALRDTGIPHAFVLGYPMLQRFGDNLDEEMRQSEINTLRAITNEYRARGEAEQASQQNQQENARTATIIYSTG